VIVPPRPRAEVRLNLSSMIDVVFILLIFIFLVARFGDHRQVEVQPPTSSRGSVVDRPALVVTVDRAGALSFEGAPVTEARLAEVLTARRATTDGVLVVLDRSLSVQRAVDVVSLARAAGFERVGLATREGAPAGEP
jgi:biopolymer transport protein ExbD